MRLYSDPFFHDPDLDTDPVDLLKLLFAGITVSEAVVSGLRAAAEEVTLAPSSVMAIIGHSTVMGTVGHSTVMGTVGPSTVMETVGHSTAMGTVGHSTAMVMDDRSTGKYDLDLDVTQRWRNPGSRK